MFERDKLPPAPWDREQAHPPCHRCHRPDCSCFQMATFIRSDGWLPRETVVYAIPRPTQEERPRVTQPKPPIESKLRRAFDAYTRSL